MATPAVRATATMTCPHAGVFTVIPITTDLKQSGGTPFINKVEAALGTIAGCTWLGGGVGSCNGVPASVTGESTALKKNGSGAILTTTVITTIGTPGPYTIVIVETQTKLKG